MAGYNVGPGDQPSDPTAGHGSGLESPLRRVALTIVDVPDDWSRSEVGGTKPDYVTDSRASRILWIGATPVCRDEPERFLLKPFTSTQLLEKVRTLINYQPCL